MDDYENEVDWMKPPWLRYWLAFTQMEPENGVPLPAPARLVARAAELEAFSDVIQSKIARAEDRQHPYHEALLSDLTVRVIKSIEAAGRLPIKDLVIQAVMTVNDPENTAAIWVELCNMAKTKRHATLRYVDEVTLEIPFKLRGWKPWGRDALEQYVRRHREDAAPSH